MDGTTTASGLGRIAGPARKRFESVYRIQEGSTHSSPDIVNFDTQDPIRDENDRYARQAREARRDHGFDVHPAAVGADPNAACRRHGRAGAARPGPASTNSAGTSWPGRG